MKNLQTIKRIAATLMTVALIFTSLSFSAFAEGEAPGTVSVSNVEAGATVKFYQFVKMADLDGQGEWVKMITADSSAKGYAVKTDGFTAADKIDNNDQDAALVPSELVTLAAKAAMAGDLTLSLELGEDDYVEGNEAGFGTYSGTVSEAGMYVVIVTHGDASKVYVYNPMAVGVAYQGKQLGVGSVDASGSLKEDTDNYLNANGTAVYAKRTEVPFDKQVTRTGSADGEGGEVAAADLEDSNIENPQTTNDGETPNYKGDTAGKGDTVHFTITSKIPAYADNYKAETLVFNIYDELSEGLTFNNDVKVFVGEEEIAAAATTWALITAKANPDDDNYGDSTFMVKFASDFIKDHFNEDVVVKYSALVDDDCAENFDPETNTARLRYTNGPREVKDEGPITTYHYTFTINGQCQANDAIQNRELVKVGVDATGAQVFGEREGQVSESGWQPLQGATFNLYKAADMKDDLSGPVDADAWHRQAVSAADGRLMKDAAGSAPGLDRLDAGIYYLVETSVPKPYKVNATPIRVVILAELYQADEGQAKAGMLKSYKIIVAGVDKNGDYPDDLEAGVVGGSYTWNHENSTVTRPVGNTTYFVEKKVSELEGGEMIKRFSNNAWAEEYTEYVAGSIDNEDEIVRVLVDPDGHGTVDEAADIRNTTSGTLPSTGGMGTVAFTVGGIVIMLAALFLLFGGKKKNNN